MALQPTNWAPQAERDFWREKCYESFYWFFQIAWGYAFNPLGGAGPKKWFRDYTHREACDWMEKHLRAWLTARAAGSNDTVKLAIIVPREWGKSTLFSQAAMLWLILHDPELAITIDSESDEKAKILLSSIASVGNGEDQYSAFSKLYGSLYNPNRTWKNNQLVGSTRTNRSRKEPTFGTCSVAKGITMQHPDVFDLDDPTSYEKIKEHSDWLHTVNEHCVSMIPVFGEGSLYIWPGTRYGHDDHFGTVFDQEGIATITGMDMPDYDPTPGGVWHVFYLSGRDGYGKPTMPHIWSEQRMQAFAKQHPLRYSAQVLNNPFTGSFSPLTLKEAEACYVEDDKSIPWRMCRFTGHMDPAFKTPGRVSRGDETTFAVWAHMLDGSGTVILYGQWGSNDWQAADLATNIINTIKKLKSEGCSMEMLTYEQQPGGYDGTWEAYLQNRFAEAGMTLPRCTSLRRSRTPEDKAKRLIDAAAFWKSQKVRIPRGRVGAEELIRQMSRIVGGKGKKDYADASADVFHVEVYRAMSSLQPNTSSAPIIQNPFDDLLKGSVKAADWWADQVAEMERFGGTLDVI